MSLVVAAGEALIVFEFRLDQVELLLADDRSDVGDDNPIFWRKAIKAAVPPAHGLEWGDALFRRTVVIAPGVDCTSVDRIGQDAPDGTITPMCTATWASHPKVGQM